MILVMTNGAKDLATRLAEQNPEKIRVGLYLNKSLYEAFRARFENVSQAIDVLMGDALAEGVTKKSVK